MLIVYSNMINLNDRALEHIMSNKGKWLADDVPENFSYEFTKFVLKVYDKVVNEKQQ